MAGSSAPCTPTKNPFEDAASICPKGTVLGFPKTLNGPKLHFGRVGNKRNVKSRLEKGGFYDLSFKPTKRFSGEAGNCLAPRR